MKKVLLLSFLCSLGINLLAQNKPNILFIEVDDLPNHYTTLDGQNPNLNDIPTVQKLADEGVYFNNAICQGTMCGPSRNSFITGTYPHNIGFYENGDFYDIPKGTWALPAALKRAGYYTAHIGKSHLHPKINGKKTSASNRQAHKDVLGFDYVWNSLGRSVTSGKDLGYGRDMYVDFIQDYDKNNGTNYYATLRSKEKMSTLPDDIYLDGLYTKLALEFIDQHKSETYFLWLNYSVPHGPYDVKASYQTFVDNDIPSVNYFDDPHTDIPSKLLPHIFDKSDNKLKKDQKGQLANISYMDYQIKRVLDAVDASGNKAKTVVVFFSDHGILVGDHHLIHKSTLYKEVLNPSLIIHDPRNTAHNGRKVDHMVELLDVVKTTMDWAGCSASDKSTPRGESLIPLLNETSGYSKDYAVAECPGYYAYVTKDYKYIAPFDFEKETDTQEVLFDLKNDEAEHNNIAKSSPSIISTYADLSSKWLASSGDVILQGGVYSKPTSGGENLSDDIFESDNNLKIYPNPVANFIMIEGYFKANNKVSIYTYDGRLVLEKDFKKPSSREIKINVESLSLGAYVVSVNGNNYRVVKK